MSFTKIKIKFENSHTKRILQIAKKKWLYLKINYLFIKLNRLELDLYSLHLKLDN